MPARSGPKGEERGLAPSVDAGGVGNGRSSDGKF